MSTSQKEGWNGQCTCQRGHCELCGNRTGEQGHATGMSLTGGKFLEEHCGGTPGIGSNRF